MPSTVVGITQSALVVPASSASPDYADGECVGGLLTLTNFAESPTGLITMLHLRCALDLSSTDIIVHLFNANPTSSTFTDNAALVIHANDRDKNFWSDVIDATEWKNCGQGLYRVHRPLVLPYSLTAGANVRTLYGAIEADGVINGGSVSDFAMWVGAEQN